MPIFTVTYVNRDGRMLDEGIGDEAIREFPSAEAAAGYIREQAEALFEPGAWPADSRYPEVDDILADLTFPDPRDNGYEWVVQEQAQVSISIPEKAVNAAHMIDMLENIAGQIERGLTSGYHPRWELTQHHPVQWPD